MTAFIYGLGEIFKIFGIVLAFVLLGFSGPLIIEFLGVGWFCGYIALWMCVFAFAIGKEKRLGK